MINVTAIKDGYPLGYGQSRELVHVSGVQGCVTKTGLVRIRRDVNGRVIYCAVRKDKLFERGK